VTDPHALAGVLERFADHNDDFIRTTFAYTHLLAATTDREREAMLESIAFECFQDAARAQPRCALALGTG
jgi:hypothetical protein